MRGAASPARLDVQAEQHARAAGRPAATSSRSSSSPRPRTRSISSADQRLLAWRRPSAAQAARSSSTYGEVSRVAAVVVRRGHAGMPAPGEHGGIAPHVPPCATGGTIGSPVRCGPCAESWATSGPQQAQDVVIEGLRRLEYRGYDSAGVALVARRQRSPRTSGPASWPTSTRRSPTTPLPESTTGIGHTRWATHGAPNDRNAHPHLGQRRPGRRRAQRHHRELRRAARRARGRRATTCVSETDTEVAAHLLEPSWPRGADLTEAMQRVCRRLEGAFTLVAVDGQDPDRVVAARRNSPLVVGVGEGENFLASDVAAFIEHTREALELGQDQVVTITRDGVEVTDFDGSAGRGHGRTTSTGTSPPPRRAATTGSCARRSSSSRAPSPTRCSAATTTNGALQLDEMRISDERAARGRQDHRHRLRHRRSTPAWSRSTRSSTGPGSPCEVELASEFRYRDPILTRSTLVVAISQSGETADTLMAIRHAREQRAKVLAICNTNGSTIPRESDAVIYTHAGPEIGVASTKGFLTQLVACYLLGLYLAQVRGTKYGDEIAQVVDQLAADPRQDPAGARPGRGGLRARPRARRRPLGAVPRPPRRLPGRARGGAEAQGARLHPRRGVRGRRAQARPDRPGRGGAAGVLRRAPARARPAARQDGQRHPGGPGPRRPHDRARRGGRRRWSSRTPTC